MLIISQAFSPEKNTSCFNIDSGLELASLKLHCSTANPKFPALDRVWMPKSESRSRILILCWACRGTNAGGGGKEIQMHQHSDDFPIRPFPSPSPRLPPPPSVSRGCRGRGGGRGRGEGRGGDLLIFLQTSSLDAHQLRAQTSVHARTRF